MSDMDIELIKTQIDSDIQNINSAKELEEFRVKYLGRKGIIAQLTSSIPTLPQEERSSFGQEVNALKNKVLSLLTRNKNP